MQRSIIGLNGNSTAIYLEGEPDECPFCKKGIVPVYRSGVLSQDGAELVYQCSNNTCKKAFVGYYEERGLAGGRSRIPKFVFTHSMHGTFLKKTFSEIVNRVSEKFEEIYNQAKSAEESGLDKIAGMGYRKALEFLVKDYIIYKDPSLADEIKKKFLGKCIKENVDNPDLKAIAELAAWLGNDETHYERRWMEKDIGDLKQLIDIAIHWLEMEVSSKTIIEEMKGTAATATITTSDLEEVEVPEA